MSRSLYEQLIILLLLASGCGGMAGEDAAPPDATVDSDNIADTGDAASTCPDVGYGMCCDGKLCNGFCVPGGGGVWCACTGDLGCPAATRCCWNSRDYACRFPDECVTCDAVGKGAGIESCCDKPPYQRYCRGTCGDAGDPYYWCTCGKTYGGCERGPDYPDRVCCPYPDGGMGCVTGTKCP